MNIKKIISKVLAVALVVATTATVGGAGIKANAAETTQANPWKTLVLVCPRTEIKATKYNVAATTLMYASEVEKVKEDAKKMENYMNGYKAEKTKMTVDVAVSDMPIESKTPSVSTGPQISPWDTEAILDKYAPEGKYDTVLLVYRNKDYSTSLGTIDNEYYPSDVWDYTNGSIYASVKLDDADHSMNFIDKQVPMYLIERFAQSSYTYFTRCGFELDRPNPPVYSEGSDVYQFNKYKRNYFDFYFCGMKWEADSKGGITREMWNSSPTNK